MRSNLKEFVVVIGGVLALVLLLFGLRYYMDEAIVEKMAKARPPATAHRVTVNDLELLQRQLDSMRGMVHELLSKDVTPVHIHARSVTIFNRNNTLSIEAEEVKEK